MAEIIPLEVPADATRGEKQIFALLKAALVPDEEFIVWFEPKPPGVRQRPDFLVWSQRTGLLIIEVKDWVIGQIAEMDATQCTILKGERREDHPSPTQQAYRCSLEYRDYLYRQPELRDLREGFGGKLIFPVGHCAAFTNIRRDEAEKIVSVMGDSSCLFADDFEIDCADPDARAGLISKLKNAFSVRFSFDALSTEQMEALRRSIFPVFHSEERFPSPIGTGFPTIDPPVHGSGMGPERPVPSHSKGWRLAAVVLCLFGLSLLPLWHATHFPVDPPSPVPPSSPEKPEKPRPKKPKAPRPAPAKPGSESSSNDSGRATQNSAEGSAKSGEVSEASILMVTTQQVRFAVTRCVANGDAVTCGIAVRSVKGDRELTIFVHDYVTPTSRVVDSTGREYIADGAEVGSRASLGASAQNMLVEGIPLDAELHFHHAALKVSSIALLEIAGELGNQSFKVQFRDVPISSTSSSTQSGGT